MVINGYIRMKHHLPWVMAFGEGLKRHGHTLRLFDGDQPERCDTAVFWSHKFPKAISAADHYVCLENPPIRQEGYASAGWDGLNGRADFCNADPDPRRAARFQHLKQPYHGGKYVLIMGQCRGDQTIAGLDFAQWVWDTAAEARRQTTLPVLFRPHPMDRFTIEDVPALPDMALADALADAMWVITYNSTSAVDAALAGCAVSACDAGSMAWDIAGHGVEFRRLPRQRWLDGLAWCQWTEDEFKNGDAWEHLKARYQ